jgi:hypothetical protein
MSTSKKATGLFSNSIEPSPVRRPRFEGIELEINMPYKRHAGLIIASTAFSAKQNVPPIQGI